jgi:hypothetical protein
MHLVSTNREALLAELDGHGEEEIRRQLAQKTYSQEKTALAQDWLRRKEQERARMVEAREEAFRLEQARAAERGRRRQPSGRWSPRSEPIASRWQR